MGLAGVRGKLKYGHIERLRQHFVAIHVELRMSIAVCTKALEPTGKYTLF